MAFTMNLYYTGKDGSARKFAEEMESSGVAQSIRDKEGNDRYEYFFSLKDPETVLLIDSWSDQEALDAHHASSTMDDIMNLRSKYDLTMRAERYVPDQDNITADDKKFMSK